MILSPERDHYRRMLNWEQGQTKRFGMHRLQRYLLNRRYFYGDNEDPDNIKQPLGIRYVPVINQKHTHYLFGEWERDIVGWMVRPWDEEDPESPKFKTAIDIQNAIYRVMRKADANRLIYKGALDGSVYGDSVFKVGWGNRIGGAAIENILPEYYHAIWNPLDAGETIECCVAFNMDRVTAHALYGSVGNRQYFPSGTALNTGMAIVWEYWNALERMLVVDDDVVDSGPNFYAELDGDELVRPGHLPFVHIPNLGVNGEYWGFGDAEQVFRIADELNYRLADIGDVVNYHAHPITLLRNFYGDVTQLPISADAVWDLGREGEAEYLEWGGPPPQVMEYIDTLIRVMLETTSLTSVAFGKIEQSQASSAALNVQMLPVTEVVRRKRALWGPALRDLALKMLRLEQVVLESEAKGKFKKTYGFAHEEIQNFEVQPKWAPILPRDRAAVVNEQIGLLSNHARSIIQSLMELDVDNPEVERERILQDVRAIAEIEAEINKELAEHEAELNKDMAETEAKLNEDAVRLQMQQMKLQHKMAMEEDPTTDPERHERHIEKTKVEHEEKRKTLETQTVAAERKAATRVTTQRVSVQSGGKNSDRHKGRANTDGGS